MIRDPGARIRSVLDRLAGDLPALGLAVSGGGDSIALMHVAAEWAQGRRVMVATVDHGLREGSAAEAEEVARAARALGLSHAVLLWRRDTQVGNLTFTNVTEIDNIVAFLDGLAVRRRSLVGVLACVVAVGGQTSTSGLLELELGTVGGCQPVPLLVIKQNEQEGKSALIDKGIEVQGTSDCHGDDEIGGGDERVGGGAA